MKHKGAAISVSLCSLVFVNWRIFQNAEKAWWRQSEQFLLKRYPLWFIMGFPDILKSIIVYRSLISGNSGLKLLCRDVVTMPYLHRTDQRRLPVLLWVSVIFTLPASFIMMYESSTVISSLVKCLLLSFRTFSDSWGSQLISLHLCATELMPYCVAVSMRGQLEN